MSSAAKVGIFMLIILAILGFFVLRIEDLKLGSKGTKTVTAVFDSVAGLDNKSTVRVAGVRVGKVKDIKLRPDGKAQVTLEVDEDVQLHRNAQANVANLGLLGEKYVELDPGTAGTPVVAAENLVLRGTQPASIDDVTNQVAAIATDVKAITESLRNVVGGPAGQQRLQDIVDNVHGITLDVRQLIAANRTNVDATLSNAREITAQLRVEIPKLAQSIDRVANSLGGTVNENRADVREIVANLKQLSTDLKTTDRNVNDITGQIRSGEGTVGKLIYSNETHDKLAAALTSVESGVNELKNTLGRATRIGMDVGIRSELLAGGGRNTLGDTANTRDFGGNSRSAVSLLITPNPERNRFYNLEVVDDPQGRRQDKVFEQTVIDPVTGMSTTTVTKQTKFDRNFLVSAQAGWNLAPFAVRVGLFESTGGAGLDYRWNDRLRFTGEAFDFGKRREDQPHVRVFGEYVVRREQPRTPQIFVRSGIDNALNNTAVTFGGGIRWRDDDLKYLLGSVPIGK
jgi:phospholipid/cholesterol/gamma-HCH transport system substrate-binding protein